MLLIMKVLAVLGFLTISCQGQNYILEVPENGDYIFQEQKPTEPSISFDNISELQGVAIQPSEFYLGSDLQTSDLPVHLQQTLLQYGSHTPKSASNDNSQNTIVNVAESSEYDKYVKPSTHKPNYSHLLSRGNFLPSAANDHLKLSESNDNLYESSGNTFNTEKHEQEGLLSALNERPDKKLDNKSLLNGYRQTNSPNLEESSKQMHVHNRQEIKELDTLYNDSTENYEFNTHSNPNANSEDKSDDKGNQNYIDEEEYEEDYLDEEGENSEEKSDYLVEQMDNVEVKNKTFEILTLKPMVTTQDNVHNDFIDNDFMDTASQKPAASSEINTQLPITTYLSSSADINKEHQLDQNITMDINFPEYVVSVVTSKTIVNNTIISPFATTESPISSSIKSSVHEEDSSTDSWIVVASVQTSKSISGARYFPSSFVEQHNINKSIKEPYDNTKEFETEEGNWSVEVTTPEIISSDSTLSTKYKSSTESLIDKLDRVQSDLSSGLLAGGFKNDNIAVIDENTPMKTETIKEAKQTSLPTTLILPTIVTTKSPYPQVNVRKFNPGNRSFRPKSKEFVASTRSKPIFTTTKPTYESDIPKQEEGITDSINILNNAKTVAVVSDLLPTDYKSKQEENNVPKILKNSKIIDDISALLPPGYNLPKPIKPKLPEKSLSSILSKAKPIEDISALLPPGFKLPKSTSLEKSTDNILAKAKPTEDISALLPPGFKLPKSTSLEKSTDNILAKAKPIEDISALLPPGFKQKTEESNNLTDAVNDHKSKENIQPQSQDYRTPKLEENNSTKLLSQFKPVTNISSLLPTNYKLQQTPKKYANNILANAKPVDDISSLLPPGYRGSSFTRGHKGVSTVGPSEVKGQNIPNNLLPPGYKLGSKNNQSSENPIVSVTNISESNIASNTTAKSKEIKLVFPSRPGGGSRKSSRLTTAKPSGNGEMSKSTSPIIQKGWPVRASTEFTGWPTPSTTPISIEKLLEAARTLRTSTSTTTPTISLLTSSTTKPTTTTPKQTTPGVCDRECDLAATVKLVGGVKWVPELLDRNTKEWQILANDVQNELERIYSSSPMLKKWYRKIRIDGFSEGSVLVDYLVELNEIAKKVNTQEIKHLFYESLSENVQKNFSREGKSLNESKSVNRVSLGNFELDPKFTDFVVIPKHSIPTVTYAEDNILLPQWAIAVIVIGLASLLFVIIFGVTILVNRHKNSKKTPTPLTEDMLTELNKNHMGGFENYAADDLYNLEAWNDKSYEHEVHKKRTNDSIYDNSMSNLYDSWRSQWNETYDNRYDGKINSKHHSGYVGSRRPKYDTNF